MPELIYLKQFKKVIYMKINYSFLNVITKNINKYLFPVVMGYVLTCLIYNFSICSFAYSNDIAISQEHMLNLLLGEFLPVLAVGIISARVILFNFNNKILVRIADTLVYAGICFSIGYFYAKAGNNLLTGNQIYYFWYVLFISIVNIIFSFAKEFKISPILSIYGAKQ